MGGKSSKTVFYTFRAHDPKDLFESLAKKKMKGANITLKPLPAGSQCSTVVLGPTLVFRENSGPSHLGEFLQESLALRGHELMVVLTPEVDPDPRFICSPGLVQLLCRTKTKGRSVDTSGVNSRSIQLIEEFLRRGGREGAHPQDSSISHKNREGGTTTATTSTTVRDDLKDAPPVVHMAYGDVPDLLLRDAVKFVENLCHLRLVESPDLHHSRPLLVFCKNSTKLQEDIRHATQNTRGGADVMLLIVTDRKDMVLTDTDATQLFGAKGGLLFDQIQQRFRSSENEQSLKWIGKFLGKYQVEVTLNPKLHRHFSLRRTSTWTNFRKSEQMGSYMVLGELSEEELKNTVLFFDDRKVGLSESEIGHAASPLVLLCSVSQQPEQRLKTVKKSRPDLRDVYVVVVHRSSVEVPAFRAFPDINHGKLATEDVSATVLDNAPNRRLVEGVRKFLRRNTNPSQRRQIPRADQIFQGKQQPESPAGEEGPSLLCPSGGTDQERSPFESLPAGSAFAVGDSSRIEPSSRRALVVPSSAPVFDVREHSKPVQSRSFGVGSFSETVSSPTRPLPLQSVGDVGSSPEKGLHQRVLGSVHEPFSSPPLPSVEPYKPYAYSGVAGFDRRQPEHGQQYGAVADRDLAQPTAQHAPSRTVLPPVQNNNNNNNHHNHHHYRQPVIQSSAFSQASERSSSAGMHNFRVPPQQPSQPPPQSSSSSRMHGDSGYGYGGGGGREASDVADDTGSTVSWSSRSTGRDSWAKRRRHQRSGLGLGSTQAGPAGGNPLLAGSSSSTAGSEIGTWVS